MATAKLVPSYERFLDRVVESMTPQEILAFQVSEAERERAEELLEKIMKANSRQKSGPSWSRCLNLKNS
jgi:trans-aconitate methyltransferase